MRNLTIFAVFLLFSHVLNGQSIQQNVPRKTYQFPDYFVLKNQPDTLFVKGRGLYSIGNGRFTAVAFRAGLHKRKFSRTELANIEAFRINDQAFLVHAFKASEPEHLRILTHGPILLLQRTLVEEVETEEGFERVKTEVFYWWQLGQMIEVNASAIAKVVEHLKAECSINAETTGSSNKDELIKLTNQLNQHCSNQIVW